MKRIFDILLTAMAMIVVALLSAFVAMRLAIHGHEVDVPSLAGMTIQEASTTAGRLGLNLHLESKFYSADVPSGHILGQFPAPGATVRREWAIRVTESIGPQEVSIPDVTGQAERSASLTLRRSALELGTVAAIVAPGDPGIVLGQTPPPNASGVDRPRVSLLLSQATATSPQALVTPQFTGLALSVALSRAGAAGLRIASVGEPSTSTLGDASDPNAVKGAGSPKTPVGYHDSFFVNQSSTVEIRPPTTSGSPDASEPSAESKVSAGTVAAQYPPAGHRIFRGDSIRFTVLR